eukprot:1651453-Rhodomonas_salina.1
MGLAPLNLNIPNFRLTRTKSPRSACAAPPRSVCSPARTAPSFSCRFFSVGNLSVSRLCRVALSSSLLTPAVAAWSDLLHLRAVLATLGDRRRGQTATQPHHEVASSPCSLLIFEHPGGAVAAVERAVALQRQQARVLLPHKVRRLPPRGPLSPPPFLLPPRLFRLPSGALRGSVFGGNQDECDELFKLFEWVQCSEGDTLFNT